MSEFKKGQYVICRYDGRRNGDVVMGRIESVRKDGHVLITSLIGDGDKPRVKRADVLAKRNVVVPKSSIDDLLGVDASRKEIAAYAKGVLAGETPKAEELTLSFSAEPGACCEARVGDRAALLSKQQALEVATVLIEFAR